MRSRDRGAEKRGWEKKHVNGQIRARDGQDCLRDAVEERGIGSTMFGEAVGISPRSGGKKRT